MRRREGSSRGFFSPAILTFTFFVCVVAFLLYQYNFLPLFLSSQQMQHIVRRAKLYNPFLHSTPSRSISSQVSSRHFTMSSTIPRSEQNSDALDHSAPQSGQAATTLDKPLALPEAPANDGIQQLDLSGGGGIIRLDHLGPMVVNRDGSLSRIANWDKMLDSEQKNTLRIIGKRNKQRLDVLKQREDQERQKVKDE